MAYKFSFRNPAGRGFPLPALGLRPPLRKALGVRETDAAAGAAIVFIVAERRKEKMQ
jgi:hypothetical protein